MSCSASVAERYAFSRLYDFNHRNIHDAPELNPV